MTRVKATVVAAFVLLTLGLGPALAETSPADLPLCQTNLGDAGQIIAGIAGLAYAPVEYDDVRVLGEGFTANRSVRNGLGVLVETPVATPASAQAVVEFLQGTAVQHRCRVTSVPSDPNLQDLAALQVGDCALTRTAGLPQLYTGHMQVWQTPQKFDEKGFWPVQVMYGSTLSGRLILLIGKAPGPGVVIWGAASKDHVLQANICPFRVVDAAGLGADLADSDLCLDQNGVPMRLKVGQTATLKVPEGDGQPFEFLEYAIGDPDIVSSLRRDKVTQTPVLRALAVGSTTIIMLDAQPEPQVRACVVQVQ